MSIASHSNVALTDAEASFLAEVAPNWRDITLAHDSYQNLLWGVSSKLLKHYNSRIHKALRKRTDKKCAPKSGILVLPAGEPVYYSSVTLKKSGHSVGLGVAWPEGSQVGLYADLLPAKGEDGSKLLAFLEQSLVKGLSPRYDGRIIWVLRMVSVEELRTLPCALELLLEHWIDALSRAWEKYSCGTCQEDEILASQ